MEENRAMDMMTEVAKKAFRSAGDPSRVLMKLQTYDWKKNEAVPQKEIEEILSKILNEGNVSLAFYPYFNAFPLHLFKGKWTSLK
jgi:hypothetical protein